MYEINKGSAPPKRLHRPARTKYPFRTMKVGDYFFVPHREKNNMKSHASTQGKLLGCKFRTRLTCMRETIEGWKPCAAEVTGAVLGIYVGRIK